MPGGSATAAVPPGELAGRAPSPRLPRLGFLGLGWIGVHRLRRLAESGKVEVAALADARADALREAARHAPEATAVASLDELLELRLDGLVVATPSALHANQAVAALKRGLAVFCQKPLGRTAAEVASVVAAARRADRLLGVDLSYRELEGVRRIRDLVRSGELGRVYSIDLTFHNAYGPDKPWFYDVGLSGGGCVMDLGVHLVDLALWTLEFPRVDSVTSRLFARGRPLPRAPRVVEDHAIARLDLASGAAVRITCSWGAAAGGDAVIEAWFYGTAGGAALRNVGGSFYDFVAERFRGTARETLAEPPDQWGGRAAVGWADALRRGSGYDPAADRLVEVASVLDRIYGR
ncbi:MAG: Gfo/Idh/MocA family protein [Gemmatimonadota bacterium]